MAQPWWKPVWSVPAAIRAVRAAVVIPALFAVADKVIANPQTALFATFGGFATLVFANFNGTRRDKLVAHAGLAIAGTLAVIIGTLASGTPWIAVLVTLPVAFVIFFAGIGGPNAASGSTAVMLAYVLPVASAGGAATIPSRLEGWWLASVAGTIAVLLVSPRGPGSQLRARAADLAGELASIIRAAAQGEPTMPEAMLAARDRLRTAFTAAPYRPTGLATADQALSGLVQLLEWGAASAATAFDGHMTVNGCPEYRDLLRRTAALFDDTRALLAGQAVHPDFDGIEAARAKSAEYLSELSGRPGEPDAKVAAMQAVHAQALSIVARSSAADALIVSHRATEATVAAARRQWYGTSTAVPARATAGRTAADGGTSGISGGIGAAPVPPTGPLAPVPVPVTLTQDGRSLPWSMNGSTPADHAGPLAAMPSLPQVAGLAHPLSAVAHSPRVAGLAGAATLVRRHASVRSVWFLNSLRGAVALAAAVAVADASGVQHAFWVVLGTLSVLRTNAAATGATAWRALAGTVVGFIIGGALLVGVGTGQTALWVTLPLALLVAAYAPGTAPFAVGQAAFTVTIVVLFNLIAPAGWRVGLLRIEDVGLGCAVSLVVGVLFWPRGAGAVVADDLADAFRAGAAYLTQAVDWALSERLVPPAAAIAAAGASTRLDDAVRGLLTEQGSKRITKDDLWALVGASTQLRLTAFSLASLRPAVPAPGAAAGPGAACVPLAGSEDYAGAPACVLLQSVATGLAGFYGAVADEIGRPGHGELTPVPAPAETASVMPRQRSGEPPASIAPAHQLPHPHLLWVQEHLHRLSASAQTLSGPALRVAKTRQRPWWR